MSALARLQAEGLRVRIGPAGKLQAAPASRLTPELLQLISDHAANIRAELVTARVWRVRLVDGTALAAVRPKGATYPEILAAVHWQFGADRVVSVEAGK